MAVEVQQSSTSPPVKEAPAAEHVKKPSFWRRSCVALLLILGFLLTPVAVLVTYAKTQVLDTGRYVASVKPLASDPAVQTYVANTIANNLLAQIDVKAYVDDALQGLPPRAQSLSGPMTSAVEGFVHEAANRAVQSSAFQQVWVTGNRVAHAQMVKVLTNEGGAVTVQKDGAVKVDLKGLAGAVQKQLVDNGLTVAEKIPTDKVSGSITVFQSKELYSARRGARVLDTVGYALPFIVVACFGGAILLSPRKRRAFIKAAFAFALGALVLALLVNGARHFYLDAVGGTVPQSAAAAFYDTLLRSLHTSVRNILLVSIVIFVAAFFSGPARPAVTFRRWWARMMASLGAGADHAGSGLLYGSPWVARNKRLLRVIVAVALFVVAFRWPHPTTAVLIWLVVLALVLLGIVEFYGRDRAVITPESPVAGGATPDKG